MNFANASAPLTVRDLDHLDYLAKLRHWTRNDAWNPGGSRLVVKNPPFHIGDFRLESGHIVQSKPLIGKPCFGVATAFLRYRHHTRYVKGRGVMNAGRCHGCKAQDACKWVVQKRLEASSTLRDAWVSWLTADGPNSFTHPHFERTHAYRCWMNLYRELCRTPFTTVNDQHVSDAYAEADRVRRERDRARKAQERRRARRHGIIDQIDFALLETAADRRLRTIMAAKSDETCPRALRTVPIKSLRELTEVWLGREVLRLRKEKAHAPAIARWITISGRLNDSASEGALITRVHRDLKRIAILEKTLWRGAILLRPLHRENEYPSKGAAVSEPSDPL